MSVIIEDEIGWGVSFTSHNPELEDFVQCASYTDAEKLHKKLEAAKQRELKLLAVIEKQYNALKNTACRTDGDGKDCWCSDDLRSGLFAKSHARYCIDARQALANSEHHDSRALEKMLLEARIEVLNEAKFGQSVLAMLNLESAKLAELNKE